MATIDDLEQRSLSELSTEELMDRIKQLRSSRREASSVKKSRLRSPKKEPKVEAVAEDMSVEALERMIAALEAKVAG